MSWAPFGKPKSWSSSAVAACASALLPTEGVSGLRGSVSPQVLNILSQILSLVLRMPPSASCLLRAYAMLPYSCSVNDTYKINACQSICGGLLTSLQTYSREVTAWDEGAELWMRGPCRGINVSVLSLLHCFLVCVNLTGWKLRSILKSSTMPWESQPSVRSGAHECQATWSLFRSRETRVTVLSLYRDGGEARARPNVGSVASFLAARISDTP